MIFQVIVSLVLIVSILLQSSKGDGLSGAIAGGGAQIGAKQNRGFDGLMSKVTKISAFLFIVIAIASIKIQ